MTKSRRKVQKSGWVSRNIRSFKGTGFAYISAKIWVGGPGGIRCPPGPPPVPTALLKFIATIIMVG